MKEKFEWIHSWSDNTTNTDLPRILLIGDSICHGYQEKVRELLKGICYVDYFSSSYTLDSKFYNKMIRSFVSDNKYVLIHLNQGLHGFHMSKAYYQKKLEKLILDIKDAKIILAETTIVNKENNNKVDTKWHKKILERNEAMHELASKYNLDIDPLYEVSLTIPKSDRLVDGIHYLDCGNTILANKIAKFIKACFDKK